MTKPIPESELIINNDGSIYHLNLKPGQVATNIIGVGDPDRVKEISKHFDSIEFKGQKREFVTHTGRYKGKRLTVISTGMGTDNIEIFMTELDALFNVDLNSRIPKSNHQKLNVFRVGTSGSMQENIPVGSFLMSEFALGLDTLMAFYNLDYSEMEAKIANEAQQKLGLPFRPYCVKGSSLLAERFKNEVLSGITVTCPGFFGPQGREVRVSPSIQGMFSLLGSSRIDGRQFSNFEMETAGYYAMGRLLGHEVLSLNAIIANRVDQTVENDSGSTVEKLIDLVLKKV